ncbi:MAG: response regulator [Novosphingobium sp.]
MPQPVMLIVEDEPLIRMCAVDFAEEAGYVTLEAGNAAEALAILERGEKIDILFTDITLPGVMDGIGLVELVAERWPTVQTMLASGALLGLPAEIAPRAARLPKPYGITQFVEAVERMNAQPSGTPRA